MYPLGVRMYLALHGLLATDSRHGREAIEDWKGQKKRCSREERIVLWTGGREKEREPARRGHVSAEGEVEVEETGCRQEA